MNDLAKSSFVVATDLRRAERSINLAARDTAQFLLTTLDVTETHKLSPCIAQSTVKATVSALAALVEGQQQLAIHAHRTAERAGTALGLTVVNWGVGDPKHPVLESDDVQAVAA